MPKLRVPPEEKENREIIALIKYRMDVEGIRIERLALMIGVHRATIYTRLNHPEDFTLAELRIISTKLHIPIEKLVKGEAS